MALEGPCESVMADRPCIPSSEQCAPPWRGHNRDPNVQARSNTAGKEGEQMTAMIAMTSPHRAATDLIS